MGLDYVMALMIEDFSGPRLQTHVFKSRLANSIHYGRVRLSTSPPSSSAFVLKRAARVVHTVSALRLPPIGILAGKTRTKSRCGVLRAIDLFIYISYVRAGIAVC
ncbi:hypothetical protein RSAG8_13279, partial [Rhizoctonia solani AG-8 WAC10335]